jgi:SAM-dependent methyltransferase
MMSQDSYTLKRGLEGAQRLEILGRAVWPSTRSLLERAGLKPGLRCVDVGCGVGLVTEELAHMTGSCVGVDNDEDFLNYARTHRSADGCEFRHLDVLTESLEPESYDVAFTRYLLSHLVDPLSVLKKIVSAVRPGGLILVEDVDFPGHFHHPPNPAFVRYLELYQNVVELRGGDPKLGRRLLELAQALQLTDIDVQLVVAVHHLGPSKRVAELTLKHVGEALIGHDLIGRSELAGLAAELTDYAAQTSSQISIAPTFQLMARKPW